MTFFCIIMPTIGSSEPLTDCGNVAHLSYEGYQTPRRLCQFLGQPVSSIALLDAFQALPFTFDALPVEVHTKL